MEKDVNRAGIIALGPDRFIEVFVVDDKYDLWLVKGESRKYIAAVNDLKEAKELVK